MFTRQASKFAALGGFVGLSLILLSAGNNGSATAALAGPLTGHGFAQIGIQVSDLNRSTRFYGDVLGLKLLFSSNGMVFFDAGRARLMIEKGRPARATTIYFDDPNIERDRLLLEARGIRFAGPIETVQRTPSYDLELLEFSDPDGNYLALMGMIPHRH